MQKIYLCFLMLSVFFLTSCSDDSVEFSKDANSRDVLQKSSWPCADGYEFVAVSNFKLVLFKSFGRTPDKDCSKGFGMCMGFSGTIVFDCVKKPPLNTTVTLPASLAYDPIEDEAEIYIIQVDDHYLKIYLSEDVVTSPSHTRDEFESFNADEVVLGDRIKLVEGEYPKVVEGDYISYQIPFEFVD